MVGARDESSFGEILAWLDRHINLEAIERGVAGRAAEPTLDRIRALCSAMGDPQLSYPVIHITGTNGKGSTTRLCSSLLQATGLSIGTLMSPHLQVMNERITHDLVPISDEDLATTLRALRDLERFVVDSRHVEVPPTWFELVTAAAFRYFADEAVEAAVVEVGLGGLYDATNVVEAEVAVLTNVALDHVEILGPTRAHIATEKAGIVKAGTTALVGDRDDEIAAIVEKRAREVGAAAVWRRDVDFGCESDQLALGGRLITVRTPGARYDDLFVPLYGAHQADNASIAVAAVEAFFGAPLDYDVVAEGLGAATVPGRLEVIERRPLVVLDGAHNLAGAEVLASALAEDFAAVEHIVLIMGCLRNRNPTELLGALVSDRLIEVIACAPDSPRALPSEAIVEAAKSYDLAVSSANDVREAIARARTLVSEDDLILVAGSLYLVGAARSALGRLAFGRP
jgi:dihydrofolate synthase/folylpolyglutamate synthase